MPGAETMHRNLFIRGIACLLTIGLFMPVSIAQDEEEDPAAPPPLPPIDAKPAPAPDEEVPIPPKVQDERLEPTVTIREDEEQNLIEEYSLDGRVYMVKVTPKVGPPYYYLDDDGDGRLELQERERAGNPVRPVYWKVKEWD